MSAEIIHGDCLDVLRGMPDASVDTARKRIGDEAAQAVLDLGGAA